MRQYDVVVIGSGPGGQRAALQAAKLGKKVAVVEKNPFIGGAGLHTGTLPSKTLRETALFLSGFRQRGVYGFQFGPGRDMKLGELMHRKSEVTRRQMEVITDQFGRNDVEIIFGTASFTDENTVRIKREGESAEVLRAEVIIIASGSRPARPGDVPFDREHIHDSDTILEIDNLPHALTIVGGGVIGLEYACIFAALGVKVTVVDKKRRILSFADEEVVSNLIHWMRESGITLKLGEQVTSMAVESEGRVVTRLQSGKTVVSEKILYTMGRTGNTDSLALENIGITPSERGIIEVGPDFHTGKGNVYAVGDVIGFPSLASTSMEQGRRAVCHAFKKEGVTCELAGHLPFGIYTIPEISMVGDNEDTLTDRGVPYEVGVAYFREVARGQITGDVRGLLKVIFSTETRRLLGVHIIGEKASDLIHIGQAVMNYGGPVDYFKDAVFNYPTFSCAYKDAALNGINKL